LLLSECRRMLVLPSDSSKREKEEKEKGKGKEKMKGTTEGSPKYPISENIIFRRQKEKERKNLTERFSAQQQSPKEKRKKR